MSATSQERDITTVEVKRDLHSRLEDLKQYPSMSFNDLIAEMADIYENQEK
jgi:hypothetical protein